MVWASNDGICMQLSTLDWTKMHIFNLFSLFLPKEKLLEHFLLLFSNSLANLVIVHSHLEAACTHSSFVGPCLNVGKLKRKFLQRLGHCCSSRFIFDAGLEKHLVLLHNCILLYGYLRLSNLEQWQWERICSVIPYSLFWQDLGHVWMQRLQGWIYLRTCFLTH